MIKYCIFAILQKGQDELSDLLSNAGLIRDLRLVSCHGKSNRDSPNWDSVYCAVLECLKREADKVRFDML